MGERAHVEETVVADGSTPAPHRGYRVSPVRRGFCVNGPYYRLTGDTRCLWWGGDGGARTRGNGCSQRVHTRAPPWVPGFPGTTRCVASRCGAGRELHLSGGPAPHHGRPHPNAPYMVPAGAGPGNTHTYTPVAPPWVPGFPGTTRCAANRCGAGRELHLSGGRRSTRNWEVDFTATNRV